MVHKIKIRDHQICKKNTCLDFLVFLNISVINKGYKVQHFAKFRTFKNVENTIGIHPQALISQFKQIIDMQTRKGFPEKVCPKGFPEFPGKVSPKGLPGIRRSHLPGKGSRKGSRKGNQPSINQYIKT